MRIPEQERLLTDVLHDESYVAFRAELRQAMLKSVRRRHRHRWMKPVLAVAACAAMLLTAQWLTQTRAPVTSSPSRVVTIRSIPLRPDQIVSTANALKPIGVVRSGMPESFSTVATVRLPVEGVSDDELLDLFKGRAVALVGAGSDKRLMFFGEAQGVNGEIAQ